jgi:outer membrane protein assembly factor BamB
MSDRTPSIAANSFLVGILLATALLLPHAASAGPEGATLRIAGVVFEDRDGDELFDPAVVKPLSGVGVSDGGQVVVTGADGQYALDAPSTAPVLFAVRPPDHEFVGRFYHLLPGHDAGTTGTVATTGTLAASFALKRAAKHDPGRARFVQTTDIHIGGEEDRQRFADAIREINAMAPPADFVVATGDLVNVGDRPNEYKVYVETSLLSTPPWFHVFGNHDANRGGYPQREYHARLGPDYYSADFGDIHLVMLNSVHPSARQASWLEDDIRALARGRRVFAFQHYAPKPAEKERLLALGVEAVFTGHWHSNKITPYAGGGDGTTATLLDITHPTFIMGGIDGSPSSFRIVDTSTNPVTSEYRINDFGKHIWISYPQGELTGPERLLASIYDTSGGVAGATLPVASPASGRLAGASLRRTSHLGWEAPLSPGGLGMGNSLPPKVTLAVEATNNRGDKWVTTQTLVVPREPVAGAVRLGGDWPAFMGGPTRDGCTSAAVTLPLAVRWVVACGGCVDVASPVLAGGRVAVSVKDRDRDERNGVMVADARTGTRIGFFRTDSAVNHSPAFSADGSTLFAAAQGGTVYRIDAATASGHAVLDLGGGTQQRWIYSSPVVVDGAAFLGSPPRFARVPSGGGAAEWTSSFGGDWICSAASPAVTDGLVIMGAMWLDKQRKPASIYAMDARTGDVRWTNECGGVAGSVAVHGGRGYAVDSKGRLKVLNLTTGKDEFTTALEAGWSLSTPAVDGDTLVVPTGAGTVHAFDLATLQPKWRFTAGRGIWKMIPYDKKGVAAFSSPTIAGDIVLIGSGDGNLYALDKATGAVRWRHAFGVPVLSTPCVSGNAVFAAAYDGNLYAFTPRQ